MSGTTSESSHGRSVIPIGREIVHVGRSSRANIRLNDPTVSRDHATLQRIDSEITVIDLESDFGTFVNGLKVRETRAHIGDKIQFGTSVTYRVCPAGLELAPDARGLEITAEGICIVRGGRTLLSDISVSIPAGSFIGILGPSGAGKSLLLNCIASHRPPSAGRVLFDGQCDTTEHRDRYRSMLGHVPQDDVIYQSLTVLENLNFAAQLRLGEEADSQRLRQTIEQALELVALSEHQSKLASVLSGGQRKRLSVAVELLRRPRLLLLDEPTSGLDPASEAHLMERLRHIARCGTTVVCATHLVDNIQLLDAVIVLGLQHATARVAYIGSPDGLLDHFQCRGFADLYERLQAGRFEPVGHRPEPSSARSNLGRLHQEGGRTPSGDTKSRSTERLSKEGLRRLVVPADDSAPLHQIATVLSRELIMLGRDKMLGVMMLAQSTILGMIVCLTQFQLERLTSLFFFVVVLAIWFGLNNSARDLVRQRKNYVRDRLAGLSPGAYLMAKFSLFLAVGVIQIALLVFVIRIGSSWVLGERIPELHSQSILLWLLVLLLSYLGGLGLGFLTSSLARTEESAIATIPILVIPQLLISVVAIGEANSPYSQDRPLRPLVVTLNSPAKAVVGVAKLSGFAELVDVMSMPLYSRPATLVLDWDRAPKGYGTWIWIGDLSHLIILVAGTWICVYLVFLRVERNWPRLIGY